MSQLVLRRSHELEHAEVHARVSAMARTLGERFGVTCRWDGDVLRIEHASVNGRVTVTGKEVVVAVRLSLALQLFSGRAEAEITRILDRELTR